MEDDVEERTRDTMLSEVSKVASDLLGVSPSSGYKLNHSGKGHLISKNDYFDTLSNVFSLVVAIRGDSMDYLNLAECKSWQAAMEDDLKESVKKYEEVIEALRVVPEDFEVARRNFLIGETDYHIWSTQLYSSYWGNEQEGYCGSNVSSLEEVLDGDEWKGEGGDVDGIELIREAYSHIRKAVETGEEFDSEEKFYIGTIFSKMAELEKTLKREEIVELFEKSLEYLEESLCEGGDSIGYFRIGETYIQASKFLLDPKDVRWYRKKGLENLKSSYTLEKDPDVEELILQLEKEGNF